MLGWVTDMIDALRKGPRIRFDNDAVKAAGTFAGVYAWWTTKDSPVPIKPMIRQITTQTCIRIGGSGVQSGRRPSYRLVNHVRYGPGCLACGGGESAWYGAFPDLASAEAWCRQYNFFTIWRSPDGWSEDQILNAERTARKELGSWFDDHEPFYRPKGAGRWTIGEVQENEPLGAYCPRCKVPLPMWRTGRGSHSREAFAFGPCKGCGWVAPPIPGRRSRVRA